MRKLRDFMFKNVYTNVKCKGEEHKAEALIKNLYGYFVENPDSLPELYKKVVESEGRERAACDYVASMSDGYVLKIYNELFIPTAWMY